MPLMNPPLPVRRCLLVVLALASAGAAGESPADPLLAGAPERIGRHRMGTLTVRVVDAEVALNRGQGHAACELRLHAPPRPPAPPAR